jgi:hypothetical protein
LKKLSFIFFTFRKVAIGNEPYHEMNRPAMEHLLAAFNRIVAVVADNGLQDQIKVKRKKPVLLV